MYKKILLIFAGLIIVIILSVWASNQLALGAPSVFISNPSTSTPTANFSFTVGTSTPLSLYGSTTLAVYGSTTIQTPVNTAHAFRIINSASTTVFEVDTINASTSVYGALTVTSCTGCSGLTGGVANTFAYWTSGTAIAATSSGLTWSNFHSTSTATSTMQGGLTMPDAMITRLSVSSFRASSTLDVIGAATFPGGVTITCTSCITDANVTDVLTIGATGSVDDGALSANVAHLNVAETISANWVNTANPWVDGEVNNDLTINSTAAITSSAGTSTFIGLVGRDVMFKEVTLSNLTGTSTVQIVSGGLLDVNAGTFRASASSSPTASSTGAFVINTTNGNIWYNDGQVGQSLVATSSFGANISSSTMRLYGWKQGTSSSTIEKMSYSQPITITEISCQSNNATTTGSNIQLLIGTGSATTTATQFCPKSGQVKAHNLGIPKYTLIYIELGTASTTIPDQVEFTVSYKFQK